MEMGVFAKRDIRRGEIIFAERPLLVVPDSLNSVSQDAKLLELDRVQQEKRPGFATLLEAAVARLPSESQADLRALHTAHTLANDKEPLLGILRTNNFDLRNLFDGSDMSANYKILNKIASRINHRCVLRFSFGPLGRHGLNNPVSCVPNVKFYFKINSFSVQFFALRDIKAGDQLFYPYCLTDRSLAQRQAHLLPYGFTCKCSGCLNATSQTDALRTTCKTHIAFFKETLINRPKIDKVALGEALRFEQEMLKEGLDADDEYLMLLMAISAGYSKLGKGELSRKYSALMEKFQSFIIDEWRGIPIPQM